MPKIVRASWEITVSCIFFAGDHVHRFAITVIPMNITPSKARSWRSGCCAAFLLRGCLKAMMPLEIASTPVSAVQPLANALSSKKIVMACSVVLLENFRICHGAQRPVACLPQADTQHDSAS